MAAAPFYLNDLSNIFIDDFTSWLLIDYGCRALSLGFLFGLVGRRFLSWRDLGVLPARGDRVFFYTLIIGTASLYLALIDYGPELREAMPWAGLANIPYDCNSPLRFWDYWFGLLLVAVSEEVVFRGLAFHACKRLNLRPILVFMLPAVAFAAIHWSSSPRNWVFAFLFGLLLMIPTYRTGSIVPAVVSHYVANLILFRCP